jgi:hypothetical protein
MIFFRADGLCVTPASKKPIFEALNDENTHYIENRSINESWHSMGMSFIGMMTVTLSGFQ